MNWDAWGMPLFTLLVVAVTLGGMYALLRWATRR